MSSGHDYLPEAAATLEPHSLKETVQNVGLSLIHLRHQVRQLEVGSRAIRGLFSLFSCDVPLATCMMVAGSGSLGLRDRPVLRYPEIGNRKATVASAADPSPCTCGYLQRAVQVPLPVVTADRLLAAWAWIGQMLWRRCRAMWFCFGGS